MEPSFDETCQVELKVNASPITNVAQLIAINIYHGVNVNDDVTLSFVRERGASFYLHLNDVITIRLGGKSGNKTTAYEGVVTQIEVKPFEWKVRLVSAGALELDQPLPFAVFKDKSSDDVFKELITQAGLKVVSVSPLTNPPRHTQLLCGGTTYGNTITYLASLSKQGLFVFGKEVLVVDTLARTATLELRDDGYIIDYRVQKQAGVVNGELTLLGTHQFMPGQSVVINIGIEEIKGVHLIGAVSHEVKEGNWTTTLHLYLPPPVQAPTVVVDGGFAGITADGQGLEVDVMTNTDKILSVAAVQVIVPIVETNGFIPLPKNNQPVKLVSTLAGPVVLQTNIWEGFDGLYHNRQKMFGIENNQPVLYTNKGAKLTLSDTKDGLTLLLSNDEQNEGGLTITDAIGNKIQMNKQGIMLHSDQLITLTANTGRVNVSNDVLVKAATITHEADAGLKLQAGATAELVATGDTTIKGAIVHIN